MGIVVLGAVFVDIKGYPSDVYIPGGRNAGRVEQVHGGVSRNLAEDIANVELRPTFISLVDNTSIGADVIRKLQDHKVNTDYIRAVPDGMGTWLAVFDNGGDMVPPSPSARICGQFWTHWMNTGTRSSGTPTASRWRSTATRRSSKRYSIWRRNMGSLCSRRFPT